MDDQPTTSQRVQREFRQEKIMALLTLMERLNCSRSTVQRRLRQWGCHTSYNHNGSFYALPDIVKFDEDGLWQYKSVCFSRHGNLRQTVVALVADAPGGLTGAELSQVLHVDANSFIGAFVNNGTVGREKLGARFVYTSCDTPVKERQLRHRREADQCCARLSCADAVTVLVELIKTPALEPAQLAQAVQSRAPTASVAAIEAFFREHGIGPVKKGLLPPL